MTDFILKSQIRWQCRRGMLELDVLLERFLNKHYDQLSENEKIIFSRLLSLDDPVLYDWLILEVTSDAKFSELIAKIQKS